MPALDIFRMPKAVSVMGRSSTITNSFVNGIVPARSPTEEDVAEALQILGLDAADLCCAYCGDRASEWDHFRPLVVQQEPTGFISEIENLVPACGKCNQSKGNSDWRSWMLGPARLSPKSRGIADLDERVEHLARFERWRQPTQLPIAELVGEELWAQYRANWRQLLDTMRESDKLAYQVRMKLHTHLGSPRHTPLDTDEKQTLTRRIRTWAARPHLNVHKIIAIVVSAGGTIDHHMLVGDVVRRVRCRNVRGAIASLMTNRGNSYGRVLMRSVDVTSIHPDIEEEVRAHQWREPEVRTSAAARIP